MFCRRGSRDPAVCAPHGIAGRVAVHALAGNAYERAPRSRWLPGLDLDRMCSFLDRRSVHIAKRAYREALQRAR